MRVAAEDDMSKMTFSHPAKKWHEALPIGDGKTAVMVYGKRGGEKLDFNDATLWSGYPKDHDNAAAKDALPRAREAAFAGKYAQANAIVQGEMFGDYTEAYMPLASVKMSISGDRSQKYRRTLDLDNGEVVIEDGGVRRVAYVSAKYGVAVYSIKGKDLKVRISAASKLKFKRGARGGVFFVCGNAPDVALPNYLRTKLFPIRYNEGKAMAFALAVKAQSDGSVSVSPRGVTVSGATYVDLIARTETGFRGYDKMPLTSRKEIAERAVQALQKPFDVAAIEAEHNAEFAATMNRQRLDVAEITDGADEIYAQARSGNADAQAVQLLYEYAKYLMLSGSRDGQPLNLQGQWNNSVRPPWSSNLTTNINFEMNYWAASACRLDESLRPFHAAAREIAERGKRTAKVNFGADGFCCNHNVDIWRNTSPVQGDPEYMYSPLCGAWIACEAFSHGLTSGGGEGADVIEGAARFCLDYLAEREGVLTVCPSVSPETKFDCGGGRSAVGVGSAFELSVVRQTLTYCASATADMSLKSRCEQALQKLAPLEIKGGKLCEWSGGFDSAEKGHRHFSPLWGVYPGHVVERGSAEFDAAKALFDFRRANSSPGIGWSAAWAICLAGRFCDGAAADREISSFTSRSLLPNFFGFHPPCYFQIDGNLGFAAGINETLVTSDGGVLTLLPALPKILPSGRMRGLAVNGAHISFAWNEGKIIEFRSDKPVKVRRDNIAQGAKLINAEIAE